MRQNKVAIIGSGIIGMFTALKLSHEGYRVYVFEKNSTFFSEQSIYNSRILHPNFESDKTKLKTKLLENGKKQYIELNKNINNLLVKKDAYIIGKIKSIDKIMHYYNQSLINGEDAKLLYNSDLKKTIPNLKDDDNIGIYFNSTYILNLEVISKYLYEKTLSNFVSYFFNKEVSQIDVDNTSLIFNDNSRKKFDYIINASGIKAFDLYNRALIDGISIKSTFNKGTYIFLKNCDENLSNKIIYPIPNENSKGILHIGMLEGLLVGPSTNLYKKFNQIPLNVNNEEINALIEESKKILLNLDYKYSNSFYGIRTTNEYGDFFIKHEKLNKRIIHLIGISSPGLTAAPAIADYVFDMI